MPYPYTDEQIRLAASVDLPMFLELRGEHFESAGKEKKLIYTDSAGRHDSITMRDNRWYDHKNQQGGGPIQFMQMFYGMSFTEAVGALIGQSACCQPRARPSPTAEKKRAEFVLPKANSNMHRVYAYLIKQRFIAPEIITHFAKVHTLYEDAEHHNAVFVGLDENGKPVAASKRSTSTYGNSFRMTCTGSDTRYSFAHYGTSDKLFIFEAPIDMLSFLTLYPEHWPEHSYIALNGVYEHPALLMKLKSQLVNTKGKKVYGYLNPDVKKTVDAIFAMLAAHPDIQKMYTLWCEMEQRKHDVYSSAKVEFPPLTGNPQFKSVKNMIIRAVDEMRIQQTVDPEEMQPEDFAWDENSDTVCEDVSESVSPPPPVQERGSEIAATIFGLLVILSQVIENDYLHQERQFRSRVDRKLRRMIQRQKEAIGLKSDGQQYQ